MPSLQPDEHRTTENTSGMITGSTPTNPRADPSNTAMKNPFGSGVQFQAEPLTQRGFNMMNRLLEGAAIGSSTGRVYGTLAAAEDIGISNNLERIVINTIGQPSRALPVQMMMLQNQNQDQNQAGPQNQVQDRPQNQNQNRPQNQNQGPAQPVLCVLCDSKKHRTGQCPIPSSVHHGDTAVCGMHNSTNRYPHRGHIFDCLETRPQSTCRIVTEKLNGIRRRDANEKEHWEFLIRWLVVERQHKAPIRVEDLRLDFVDLILYYANYYCDDEMPQQVNFTWPYTKAEARRYEASLRRYDELGPDQMPWACWTASRYRRSRACGTGERSLCRFTTRVILRPTVPTESASLQPSRVRPSLYRPQSLPNSNSCWTRRQIRMMRHRITSGPLN